MDSAARAVDPFEVEYFHVVFDRLYQTVIFLGFVAVNRAARDRILSLPVPTATTERWTAARP